MTIENINEKLLQSKDIFQIKCQQKITVKSLQIELNTIKGELKSVTDDLKEVKTELKEVKLELTEVTSELTELKSQGNKSKGKLVKLIDATPTKVLHVLHSLW